jgi:dipeptidyl aminopeptidase/acylaminoacyl peptidase
VEDLVVRQSRVALPRSLLVVVVVVACAAPAQPSPRRPPPPSGPALPTWTVGALHVIGAPPLDPAIETTLDRYTRVTSSRLLDVADDGSAMLALRGGDVVEIRAPGGDPVTRVADADAEWAAFADAGAIVYTADHDGDEELRLYRRSAGAAERLADRARVTDPILDRARGRVIWAEPSVDGQATSLWWSDGTRHPRRVFTGDGTWAPLDVSADGAQLLARRYVSTRVSALYRIDVERGTAVALTPVGPRVATPAGRFAGGVVYAISDGGGDHLGVWELSPRTARPIVELAWDITELAVSPDGATLAFVSDEDGGSVVRLYDVATRTQRIAPGVPDGGVLSELRFAAGGSMLAFSFTDPRHPRDVYTYDLRTARATAWTHAGGDRLAPVAPERARITSFDGTPLSVLAYHPTATAPAPAPVIVELHGGPEDQWQLAWSAFDQFLVSRGFAVIQPNVRGSTGYGAAFEALDDAAHRGDAVRDVRAVIDWIATRPELDRRRVAVMGTSYGGYLALAAVDAEPDRLRAGVELVGITDLVAFLEHTGADRRDQRRAEYGDERDPQVRARLAAASPSAHAPALRVPILAARGQRDRRVPADAAARYVAAVRAGGGTVWELVADDEGHGFTKTANRGVFEVLVVQFLAAALR